MSIASSAQDIIDLFMKKHWNRTSPLLLALSGGPDSQLLYDCLLTWTQTKNLQLHVLHVDHGWRKESAQEAKTLSEQVQKDGLVFHLVTLSKQEMKGNLEDACREARLKAYRDLSRQYSYQAVVLGHHADDRKETILKRILEGAHLWNLGAFSEKNVWGELKLWRPLLPLSKEHILSEIKRRSLKAIVDHTNEDTKFLRARMRKEIFPHLEEKFGKTISSSLLRIGDESCEMKDYWEHHLRKFDSFYIDGCFGAYLDLSEVDSLHELELKLLAKRFCERQGVCISASALKQLVYLLQTGSANKQVSVGNSMLKVDRKRLFLCRVELPVWKGEVDLEEEMHEQGWYITYSSHAKYPQSSWKALWKGCFSILLTGRDLEDLVLKPFNKSFRFKKWKNLDRYYTEKKVPAFLRNVMPLVCDHSGIVCGEGLGERVGVEHMENTFYLNWHWES